MVNRTLVVRNMMIPAMLFLGACCCGKDVVVAPQPSSPSAPARRDAPAPASVLGDTFYDFDKSVIRPDAVDQLKANAAWLQANDKRSVTIEGHCDERGTDEYNIALGERRAVTAKGYLVNLGIPANRLKTVSFGEERPFATGHNEEAWAQNRRAHFVAE
jgi:peptidoglycan-associated lipoprotein